METRTHALTHSHSRNTIASVYAHTSLAHRWQVDWALAYSDLVVANTKRSATAAAAKEDLGWDFLATHRNRADTGLRRATAAAMVKGVAFVTFYKHICIEKNVDDEARIVSPEEWLEYTSAYQLVMGKDPRRAIRMDPSGDELLMGDSVEEAMNFSFDFKHKVMRAGRPATQRHTRKAKHRKYNRMFTT